jgi:hypothetical protein
LCGNAVFSGNSLKIDNFPSLPYCPIVIILRIKNLEAKKNGPTQSRKAKEGKTQPQTAGIL